jgi:hypothetical protein
VRERSDKLVREDAALFVPPVINKRDRQTDYEAKGRPACKSRLEKERPAGAGRIAS